MLSLRIRLVSSPAIAATLLATAPRREGTLGKLGLSPIAEALRAHEKSQAEPVAV